MWTTQLTSCLTQVEVLYIFVASEANTRNLIHGYYLAKKHYNLAIKQDHTSGSSLEGPSRTFSRFSQVSTNWPAQNEDDPLLIWVLKYLLHGRVWTLSYHQVLWHTISSERDTLVDPKVWSCFGPQKTRSGIFCKTEWTLMPEIPLVPMLYRAPCSVKPSQSWSDSGWITKNGEKSWALLLAVICETDSGYRLCKLNLLRVHFNHFHSHLLSLQDDALYSYNVFCCICSHAEFRIAVG